MLEKLEKTQPEPRPEQLQDRFYLNFILFFAFGVVGMVPSHFVMTATNYWLYKFRDPSSDTWDDERRNDLQKEFTANAQIVNTVSSVIFMMATVLVYNKIGMWVRLYGSLAGIGVVFVGVTIFAGIDTDSWQSQFAILMLAMIFIFQGFCSIFLVSSIAIGAKFPTLYAALIPTGQTICGTAGAVIQIVSLSIGTTPQSGGLAYFIVGLVLVTLTTILFIYNSKRSEFFIYHIERNIEKSSSETKMSWKLLMKILYKLRFVVFSLASTTGITVMVNPSVTSLVTSMDSGTAWTDTYFTPVITYLVLNVADIIGRGAALKIQKPSNEIAVVVMSILRISFVPIFMFCNVQPRSHLDVIFNEDYFYIIFVVIFGLSNGYIVNLCVIHISAKTTDEERTAGMFILIALLLGSALFFSFTSRGLIAAI